eukprot:6199743-Pleurochrysis_carterae.AAC.5
MVSKSTPLAIVGKERDAPEGIRVGPRGRNGKRAALIPPDLWTIVCPQARIEGAKWRSMMTCSPRGCAAGLPIR